MTKSEIKRPEQPGEPWHGYCAEVDASMSVVPTGEGQSARMYFRNAVKLHPRDGTRRHIRWLVGELDGVKVYVCETGRIIVTRADLWP